MCNRLNENKYYVARFKPLNEYNVLGLNQHLFIQSSNYLTFFSPSNTKRSKQGPDLHLRWEVNRDLTHRYQVKTSKKVNIIYKIQIIEIS